MLPLPMISIEVIKSHPSAAFAFPREKQGLFTCVLFMCYAQLGQCADKSRQPPKNYFHSEGKIELRVEGM